MDISVFFSQYLITALWASIQDDDTPMDATYDTTDFDPETRSDLYAECEQFIKQNESLLSQAGDDSQNGHDFWLTRNGHGAGFLDRDYDDDVAKKLSEACDKFGSCVLYVGDDNKIYKL